jgi:hypothetical protein
VLILEVAAGLAVAYAAISCLEWYSHRYMMHRNGWLNRIRPDLYRNHHLIHHPTYRGSFTEPDPERHRDVGLESDAVPIACAAALVAAPLWPAWAVGSLCFVAMATLFGFAWTAFHREMHTPRGRWFARTNWYRACLRHHELHHLYPRTNFCVLFLGADRVFGTRCIPGSPAHPSPTTRGDTPHA